MTAPHVHLSMVEALTVHHKTTIYKHSVPCYVWFHLAISVEGENVTVFVNGVLSEPEETKYDQELVMSNKYIIVHGNILPVCIDELLLAPSMISPKQLYSSYLPGRRIRHDSDNCN